MERMHILLLLLLFTDGLSAEDCSANIAVIGGGIGGASASHFISELFNDGSVKIDLYEAERIGGRLATIGIGENEYEAGGSIIHPRNRYMDQFTKLLGLERMTGGQEIVGIWNGDEFPYETSEWKIISMLRLVYRYGIQPFKLNRYISSILSDFEKIYDLQEAGRSYENVTALLSAMSEDFPKMTQVSMRQHFLEKGFGKEIIEELMKATVVVNYGQETDIHSFVGSVSVAAMGSDLWSVKGGNKKVPEELIQRNKNANVVPLRVTRVVNTKNKDDKIVYEVYCANKDGSDFLKSVYDIVILATPLTADQRFPIAFEGFPKETFDFTGEYHTLRVTFLSGDLNPKYFGLDRGIDAILSCEPNKTIINSVGRLNCVQDPETDDGRVWKLFSNAPLDQKILNNMFSKLDQKREVVWKAYPRYQGEVPLGRFRLASGFYHVNAIEWAASAMEMSAIAGRNVAILAFDELSRKCPLWRSRATPRMIERGSEL